MGMPFDYAIHSDFLVHWTGKDLDQLHEPDWKSKERSDIRKGTALCDAYLDRLHKILKYGLWLTEEDSPPIQFGGDTFHIPRTPMTCFTELKLSESRVHASRYGRLGIGFKRKYVFNRLGRPLTYYWFNGMREDDPFLRACTKQFADQRLLNFVKPMGRKGAPITYDWYAESEWRILFREQLLPFPNLLIDPRDPKNVEHHAYFNSLTKPEQDKLKYLVPLDGWFQLIIYPSLWAKNAAQQEHKDKFVSEILRIKSQNDDGNRVEGGNWPMEIDLDACRNF